MMYTLNQSWGKRHTYTHAHVHMITHFIIPDEKEKLTDWRIAIKEPLPPRGYRE